MGINLNQVLISNGGADTTGESFPVGSAKSSLWVAGVFGGATVTFELSRDNITWIAARDDFDDVYAIDSERAGIRLGWLSNSYNIRVKITGGSIDTKILVIRDSA